MTIFMLLTILIITAAMPLIFKKIGDHLEPFLFVMGISASLSSRMLTLPNIQDIFTNKLLYIITGAVLVVSFLFRVFENKVGSFVDILLRHFPLKIVVFILIIGLGFMSSIITAIVASLLLTEFVSLLPLERKNKIKISIIACFAIGLGAVLTPVGEPLSTIAISRVHGGFFYMLKLLGAYILPCVILLGLFGTFFADNNWREKFSDDSMIFIPEHETVKTIVLRAANIFIFVVGLDLLGNGFKPLIDTYVIHWNNNMLYAANLLSAILDNATLAAAEISPAMSMLQIKAILISLLVSGGMLVTGNIPNIVTAGKLKITMKEWAKFAFPLGMVLLIGFYVILFII